MTNDGRGGEKKFNIYLILWQAANINHFQRHRDGVCFGVSFDLFSIHHRQKTEWMKRNEDNCQIWNELDTRHLSHFVSSMRVNGKSIIVRPFHSRQTHRHTQAHLQSMSMPPSGGKFGFKVNDFLHCLIIFNAQWCSSIELSQSSFMLWKFY